MMYGTCSVGAPGIMARGIRVFIEGVVAFGLGGFIYVRIFFLSEDGCMRLTLNALFDFDRGSGVVCSQYITHVRHYCRIHGKRCHQVQTYSGPVVQ